MASRVLYRIPKTNAQLLLVRTSLLPKLLCGFSDLSRPASSLSKWLSNNMSLLRHSYHRESIFQRFGFSSSAFSRDIGKERSQSEDQDNTSSKVPEPTQETSEAGVVSELTEPSGDSTAPEQSNGVGFSSNSEQIKPQSSKKWRGRTKRTVFSDSDTEPALSVEELVKLIAERDNLLKIKQEEIEKMQEKVLRTYAEMENVLERTKREVENSKKYGIQNFAKGLLDVADNLGRAADAVKENFSKIDQTGDNVGVTLLKSLLEGVEMTEKQLAEC